MRWYAKPVTNPVPSDSAFRGGVDTLTALCESCIERPACRHLTLTEEYQSLAVSPGYAREALLDEVMSGPWQEIPDARARELYFVCTGCNRPASP